MIALNTSLVGCRDGQMMRVGIDSVAARSVVPSTWHVDYPLRSTAESRSRTMYRTVTGAPVADEGLRTVSG